MKPYCRLVSRNVYARFYSNSKHTSQPALSCTNLSAHQHIQSYTCNLLAVDWLILINGVPLPLLETFPPATTLMPETHPLQHPKALAPPNKPPTCGPPLPTAQHTLFPTLLHLPLILMQG